MIRYLVFLALCMTCLSGCVTINYPVPSIPGPRQEPNFYSPTVEKDYIIQVGDVLAVRSYFESQLNQEVTVRSDGKVSLLLMGDVEVVGLTPEELRSRVTEAYSAVADNPDFTVVVLKSSAQSVYVGGEVQRPSMQPMEGQLTLMQAITTAGGLLVTANRSQVLLLRHQRDGRFSVYKADIEKVLKNEVPDFYLQRRDVIFVPKTLIANINDFVNQYVNNIIPHSVSLTYGWFHGFNK